MKKTMTFQEGLDQLEALVLSLEKGELNIDELSEKIKTATDLLQYCKETLHSIEKKLNIEY
ncbi:MAG: exodeoxyribonuclease VII small subunit [Prevotellaceae bacterium]|jgi:exodeoxyribonuclease VII small subunit|nr:exodeoxyribonuclease VII small subunit [Prevotellaceae bacterium]